METGNETSDGNIGYWSSLETGAALDKIVHDTIVSPFARSCKTEAGFLPYSADLENTLGTVVEIMRTRGYSFSLTSVCYISSVSWGWTATFSRSVYPPRILVKDGVHVEEGIGWQSENPATAVCIAALRVLDMEGREISTSKEIGLPFGGEAQA